MIPQTRLRTRLLPAALLLASCAIAGGFYQAIRYDSTPGAAAACPADWPGASELARDPALPTLVLTLHPECPCSRATLAELARLLADAQRPLTCHILFATSQDDPDPTGSSLYRTAAGIPGAHPVADTGHESTALFHAQTSGQAFLYDREGHLLFHGGITGSRGHEGDNDGRALIETYLATGRIDHSSTPVFGCALQ